MVERLMTISAIEGLFTDSDDLMAIAEANAGDLRNAINTLQAYHSLPIDERRPFLDSLWVPMIDARAILTLCMKEQRVEEAVKLIDEVGNLRKSIDAIFHYGINSPAKPENKLKLVDASTQAQRDLLMGVESHYVMWDFCRRLSERQGLYTGEVKG